MLFFSSVLGLPSVELCSSFYCTYSFILFFPVLLQSFCVIFSENILLLVCSRMKVKNSSSKASYVAKNSPSFCESWIVNKGTLLWTKASAESTPSVQTGCQSESAACSVKSDYGIISKSQDPWSMSARFISWDPVEADRRAAALLPTISSSMEKYGSRYFHTLSNPLSDTAVSEKDTFKNSDMKVEEENLYSRLEEVEIEAAALRKRKRLEAEALEAFKKVI